MLRMKHLHSFVRSWVAAACALVIVACDTDDGPVGAGFEALPSDVVLTDVTHNITSEGVRYAKLVSDSVYQYQDSSTVALFGVDLTLYDASGNVSATVTSLFGDLNERTNEMVARGNVVVLRADGTERIETEELHYNPQTHRIWSTVHTTRTIDGCTQEGDGVETDDQFRSVQLENARGCLPGEIVF